MITILAEYDNGRDRLQFEMRVDEDLSRDGILYEINRYMVKRGWWGTILGYEVLDEEY